MWGGAAWGQFIWGAAGVLNQNSAGFGQAPFGIYFGDGPYVTMPFTPAYVFGLEQTYAVVPHRYEDLTEQRYLTSYERGTQLSYQFPYVSSADHQAMTAFFTSLGPGGFARVTDHRTGRAYIAQFFDPQFTVTQHPTLERDTTWTLRTIRPVSYPELLATDSPAPLWYLRITELPNSIDPNGTLLASVGVPAQAALPAVIPGTPWDGSATNALAGEALLLERPYDKHARFQGTSAWVFGQIASSLFPGTLLFGQSFGIEAIVRASAGTPYAGSSGGYRLFEATNNTAPQQQRIGFCISSGGQLYTTIVTPVDSAVVFGSFINDDQVHHVVTRYLGNAGVIDLWVDGVLVGSGGHVFASSVTLLNQVNIGANAFGGGLATSATQWPGTIGEVAVYSGAPGTPQPTVHAIQQHAMAALGI